MIKSSVKWKIRWNGDIAHSKRYTWIRRTNLGSHCNWLSDDTRSHNHYYIKIIALDNVTTNWGGHSWEVQECCSGVDVPHHTNAEKLTQIIQLFSLVDHAQNIPNLRETVEWMKIFVRNYPFLIKITPCYSHWQGIEVYSLKGPSRLIVEFIRRWHRLPLGSDSLSLILLK